MENAKNIINLPAHRTNKMTSLRDAFAAQTQLTTQAPADLYWECKAGIDAIHKGCGWIEPMQIPSGRWIRRSCACERQKRYDDEQEMIRAAWMANQMYRTFGGWLGVEEYVDTSLGTRTFASFDRSRQPDAFHDALRFADSMAGNIVFYGAYGTGKTHLAAAICNAVRERRVTSLFTTAPKFFATHNDRMHHEADHHALIKQAIGTPLLVIDDVDKANWTQPREDIYFLILDERHKAMRPTILTTNRMFPITDKNGVVIERGIEGYIGKAARSRITMGLTAIEMVGNEDYRLEM